MSWLFSMMNWTALFLECMSAISRSRLVSLIMVGAKTTARFLGVICFVLAYVPWQWRETSYQVLAFSVCDASKVEDEEFEAVSMLGR